MNLLNPLTLVARPVQILLLAAALGLIHLAAAHAADAAADPGAPAAEVTLRRNVVVETVRLGDLFDGVARPETVIAYAPRPGRRAVFDANWLFRTAVRQQLDWRPSSRIDRVVVARASTVVTANDVANAVRDEVLARDGQDDIEVSMSNRAMQLHIATDLPATVGVLSLSVDSRTERFSAVVEVPAGDPKAERLTVNGNLYRIRQVPVLAENKQSGDVIEMVDIDWIEVRQGRIRRNTVTSVDDLIGKEPRRVVRAGQAIRIADLRTPRVVTKGHLVTMTYETDTMKLTASGKALDNGALDDVIRIMNSKTRLVVGATVVGPNRVVVASSRQLAQR